MKPNYLVIGAPKAATTSLCHLLGQHPDVFMSEPKEPRFFSHDSVYQRGWRWYESLFRNAAGCTAVGEGSTSYSMTGIFPETVPRIVTHLTDARIIYIVRHPLKRVESGWMQSRQSANPVALPSFNQSLRERPHFVDSSRYWKQLNAYREYFPDERILVLFFEDFVADARSVLSRCFRFLEVDSSVMMPDAHKPLNPSATHSYDRWLLTRLRRMPMFDQARRAVPKPLGRLLERVLRKRFKERPKWEQETRLWFVDQIADDIRNFLDFCGKPADFWDLNPVVPGEPKRDG